MINDFFNWCVWVLEVIGDFTGLGAQSQLSMYLVYGANLAELTFISN